MRNYLVILFVLLFVSVHGQDKWKGIYSSTNHNIFNRFHFTGMELAYMYPRASEKKYRYWELSNLVFGTFHKTFEDEKLIQLGIGYGLGYYFLGNSADKFKLRWSHSSGIYFLHKKTIPNLTQVYVSKANKLGIYYKPKIQAEYKLNSRLSALIGLSGMVAISLNSSTTNNVFVDKIYRDSKYFEFTFNPIKIEIGIQYKIF